MAVTLKHILQAAETITEHIGHTPCTYSKACSQTCGAEIVLKFENLQKTGSFKARGAVLKLLSLTSEQRKKGIIAMSAGNHAQAVACYAEEFHIPALIVMPRHTSNTKVEQTRKFGAEVLLQGESFEEANDSAKRMACEQELHLVHPYDDEVIITGQGTVALEMLHAHPDLDVLIVPVGGGGLIAGCAVAAKGIRPNIQVIGVQTERFPAVFQTLKGLPVECGVNTIAEGIALKNPGTRTLPIVRSLVDEILLVNERDLEQAVLLLLQKEKTVVEGAGAAGLAALLTNLHDFTGKKVGVILSGGNIDFVILSSIIQRGLVRSGRLVRLLVELRDIPGALADVSHCISQTDANIVEVHHQRAFTHLPLPSAEVEFVLLTRGLMHIQEIATRLNLEGYKTHRIHEHEDVANA
ncbi:MAG: threonine ammonia-lyase [Nitrospirales bacterium]|nr:MAG: threonine ammonia-lyase [Nitrospirales bacterium]